MNIGQRMLGEFDEEMKSTRRTLERVPEEKWNWKPHEKSGSVGWMASHIATMVGWGALTIQTDKFDYAPVDGGASVQPPKIENRRDLLAEFDKNVAEAREALANASDVDMLTNWSLLGGGKVVFTMPRVAVMRHMVMNHLIHHRGQLLVYYRLLGVPVPGLYGPSADEAPLGAETTAAD